MSFGRPEKAEFVNKNKQKFVFLNYELFWEGST